MTDDDFTPREEAKFTWWSSQVGYALLGVGILVFAFFTYTTIQDLQATNDRQDKQDDKIAVLTKENRALILSQQQFTDQSCKSDEREHKLAVKQLLDTYAYLKQLTPEELADAQSHGGRDLNRFVIARLPETERAAAHDVAPDKCDDLGLGLPEPDPCVPGRPKFLGGDGKPVVGPPCKPVRRPPS